MYKHPPNEWLRVEQTRFHFCYMSLWDWWWVWALFFFFAFCTHREMDRLGIITPSHQDIITASLQQEMLSQMQHMQRTMVPVWVGKKDGNLFREEFSFTSSVHFRGTFRRNERERERERKAALLPTFILWNFLKKKERQEKKKKKKKTVDTDTDSSKLLWAPAQAPSS